MAQSRIDRTRIRMRPLAERRNKREIERDHVPLDAMPSSLGTGEPYLIEAVERILSARKNGRSVMLSFGAHTIKNGLAPVIRELISKGWVTHLATNGAGVIHDWEFSYQGKSSEDVEYYVARGQFGHWHETGHYLNLAINVGAYRGLGYGESVGAMIHNDGVDIPRDDEMEATVMERLHSDPEKAAAAGDLLAIARKFALPRGRIEVPHRWKNFSVQAGAYEHGVPFTAHPMFGHDIIYNHPMNHGACLGRAAIRDYLTFAEGVNQIDGGVYLSIGSAVMSPMIFEKAMSMARNLAIQEDRKIERHYMLVVDLARSNWDWSRGEPPENHPDYYLRFNKTFSRMGGTLRYVSANNRDFLLHLYRGLVTSEA